MRNYDFHELLSPEEFQHFAVSILKIRENKQIRSNIITRDGGIDLYCFDDDIIGQVKNYQNDASKVVSSLEKEVNRIKKLNPKRYIIITSAIISREKRKILLNMFAGYLNDSDILDKNDLNELLCDPKYHKLEIEYLKLLVPNSFVLSHYLSIIENNDIYTRTELELDKIKEDKKIFSINETFFAALDKLLSEKTIIISGEPGIGKTMLGRMLSAYLINTNPDIEFISICCLKELFKIYRKDNSQVYFFDDFWGDTRYNFKITEKEKEDLLDFIKYIRNSNNKWLIITTREYVFKDGIQLNYKIKDKFKLYKFSIDFNKMSKISKFNILYNVLKNKNLSWDHLSTLLHYWQSIINRNNYNPRYIETFFLIIKNIRI